MIRTLKYGIPYFLNLPLKALHEIMYACTTGTTGCMDGWMAGPDKNTVMPRFIHNTYIQPLQLCVQTDVHACVAKDGSPQLRA